MMRLLWNLPTHGSMEIWSIKLQLRVLLNHLVAIEDTPEPP